MMKSILHLKTKANILLWGVMPLVTVFGCSNEPAKRLYQETDIDTFSTDTSATNSPRVKLEEFVTITKHTHARTLDGKFCHFSQNTKLSITSFVDEYGVVEIQTTAPLKRCFGHSIFMFAKHDITLNMDNTSSKANRNDYSTMVNHNSESFYKDIFVPKNKNLPKNDTTAALRKRTSYHFPLFAKPLDDYTTGGREFGAQRAYGRKHAANDLLEYGGYPVYAVADGIIVDFYYFYDGTNAIVVDHYDFVVRYGEVSTMAYPLQVGSQVQSGQKVGYVGTLGSGHSMLHFEQYSGEESGLLTVRSNHPFQRRKDLVNPTRFLHTLEDKALYPNK